MNSATPDRRSTFDALYANDPDPWDYETSVYERQKRRSTIAALSRKRYERALEVGCSIGTLTQELAPRCKSLIAIDVAEAAIERASRRLAASRNVVFYLGEIPSEWPEGSFDLIVLSEVLYFLTAAEIETTSRLCYRSLRKGGECLLVNWTGHNDLPIDGIEASNLFTDASPWNRSLKLDENRYRIDLLRSS
ncbi:class I SAM-dependent DNA methyltransferase [Alteriqipengyuania sp. 357]